MPLIYGLSLDFSVFLVTCIFLISILIISLKSKKLKIEINNAIICSIVLLVSSILTLIWGIDKTDSKIGIMRFLSLVIFIILIMQFSEEKRERIIQVIPYSGLFILFLSLIIGLIPNIKNIVYSTSGRLTGFFDYANTFALYLLIGMIIFNEKNEFKYSAIINFIFIIGIIITGSRTTFILSLIYIIYSLFTKKTEYKKINIIIYLGTFIAGLLILITQNIGNFTRIFSISINSGTLLERIIYWKDGLKLLKSNLFGYGYMGYFYKIPEAQTAMYTTKFIHNEYLQMALDIGIIPALIFLGFLIKNLFSKENSRRNKMIIITIMLHMFIDFDLQFMMIFYILLLCFDSKSYKEFEIDTNITLCALLIMEIILYGYWGIATFMHHIKKDEISQKMLNNYTESNVEFLSSLQDINKAYDIANKIEYNNKYIPLVYNVKALYYMKKEDIENTVKNEKKQIELSKYDEKVYEEYVMILSKILDSYAKNTDDTNVIKCINYIIEVEEMVKNTNSNMDKLVYKIRKNPEIKLNENILKYIKEMKEIKREGSKENE